MSDKRKASRPWIVVAMVTLVVPGVLFYLFAGDRPAPPDDALTSAPSAKISPADDRRSLSPRQDNQASDAPTLPTAIAAPQSAAGRAARSKADLDPARDGWDSEAASHLADQQLRLLAAKIKHPEQLTAAGLEPLLAPKFTCTPLQHESREIFNDSMFHVEKSDIDRSLDASTHHGVSRRWRYDHHGSASHRHVPVADVRCGSCRPGDL